MGENMIDTDFDQFVSAIRSGDDQAAEELLQRYGDYLRRMIRIRLSHYPLDHLIESGDILQTILKDFFREMGIGKYVFTNPDSLRRFLVVMARNRIVSKSREEKHHTGHIPDSWDTPDERRDSLASVDHSELIEVIRNHLTKEECWLFDQHKIIGRPWMDIAASIGGTPEALRMKLTRALSRVKKVLK
jgi:DNA-directed RNA polymerase specialized sigma24 family protein